MGSPDVEIAEQKQRLLDATSAGRTVPLDIPIAASTNMASDLRSLKAAMSRSKSPAEIKEQTYSGSLPRSIRFAFARHACFPELCDLVDLFRPRDVWPCTESPRDWILKCKALDETNIFANWVKPSPLRSYSAKTAQVKHLHTTGTFPFTALVLRAREWRTLKKLKQPQSYHHLSAVHKRTCLRS